MPTMETQSKALREERAGIVQQMRDLSAKAAEEKRGFTAEEEEKFEKMDTAQEELRSSFERVEKMDALTAELETSVETRSAKPGQDDVNAEFIPAKVEKQDPVEFHNATYNKWLQYGFDGLGSQEERSYIQNQMTSIPQEIRAQAIGTPAAGGATVAESFSNELERGLKEFGGMFEASRILSTATGANLPWPTVDDTNNRAVIVAENNPVTPVDVVFGTVNIGAFMYGTLVQASLQVLQDTAFKPDIEISSMLIERMGRGMNEDATVGAGGGAAPNGIVTAVTAGGATTPAAAAGAVSFGDWEDLKHSVDPAHRRSSSVGWMFNDATLVALKKLLKTDGQPLWQPNVAVGEPDRLDGDAYTINQDMPDIGTGQVSMLYGDFNKYIMRIVLDAQVARLTERYAEFLQVGFLGWMRFDSQLIDAGTNPIKGLLHP